MSKLTAEQEQAVEEVCSVIEEAFAGYRSSQQFDGDGDGLPLVDILTPDADSSIANGSTELTDLINDVTDDAACALRDVFRRFNALATQPKQGGDIGLASPDNRSPLTHIMSMLITALLYGIEHGSTVFAQDLKDLQSGMYGEMPKSLSKNIVPPQPVQGGEGDAQ